MRRATPLGLAMLAFAAAACSDTQPTSVRAPQDAAPVRAAAGRAIPGEYIVVLNPDGNPRSVAAIAGVSPKHVYTAALNGFSASLNAGQLNALQHNPNVAYVEEDQVAQATTTQSGATWGLDRIDQRDLPLNGTYNYTPTGAGVRAYIIDTGILRHATAQFGGRAVGGLRRHGGNGADCNGHGTHVAGTVGGSTYGVAKGVTLIAVRVLDCDGSGTNAGVIAGIDWVASNRIRPGGGQHVAGRRRQPRRSTTPWRRLTSSGVTLAVAAGNENQNACNASPARAAAAITVGATTSSDARASFSNYGELRGRVRAGLVDHLGLEHVRPRPPTPSAAPRWPPRTWPAWPRCTCRAPPAPRPPPWPPPSPPPPPSTR